MSWNKKDLLDIESLTAVDGSRMHDERVGFSFGETRFVEAEELGIFADAGKHRLALARTGSMRVGLIMTSFRRTQKPTQRNISITTNATT